MILDDLWEALKEAFEWVINRLEGIVMSIFATLWDMMKDVLIYVIDTLLEFAVTIIDGLFLALDWNPADYIAGLHSDVSNVLGLIGLGEATVIISGAIVIRLLLQLIPFVRLGS